MSGLTFVSHETPESLAALEAPWRELHGVCTYRSIYNSFDFVMASVTAFSEPDIKLFVLSATRADTVVAIFPFQISLHDFYGVRLKVLEYAAQWESDKPYPLFRGGFEDFAWRELVRFLSTNRRRWNRFNLIEIREGLAAIEELPRLFRLPRYWVRSREDNRSPLMKLGEPWHKRWETHRKMRKRVRRMERSFGDRLHFQIFDQPDTWQDCLQAYVELESRGWKAGRVGVGKDRQTLSFYNDLFARLAAGGHLSFGVLSVDGEPVALEIAYTFGAVVYFSHGTFDEKYATYSPGMVSTAYFLRHFHGADFDEGDYLAGFAAYVAPWADLIVPSHRLVIHRVSPAVLYSFAVKGLRKLLPARRSNESADNRRQRV